MGLQKLNNNEGKPLRKSLGTQLSVVGEGGPAEHSRWKEDPVQNPPNSRELDSLQSRKEACVYGGQWAKKRQTEVRWEREGGHRALRRSPNLIRGELPAPGTRGQAWIGWVEAFSLPRDCNKTLTCAVNEIFWKVASNTLARWPVDRQRLLQVFC